MIDTVVFDIGNVLAEWHWRRCFEEWFDAAAVEDIAKATVQSREWLELDRGALPEDEVIKLLVENDPRYSAEIEYVVRNNHRLVTTYPYAAPWLHAIRAAGYKVYILSNFGNESFNRARPKFDFLKETDGVLISYELQRVKPEREVYEALFQKFSIVPANAVFLDDVPKNIDGAVACGMQGIVVQNKEQADRALAALGVRY